MSQDNQLNTIKDQQPLRTNMGSADRMSSLDMFRGFAIVTMVVVNFLANFDNVPDWAKHHKSIGIYVADVIAPLFIFAISLTFKSSLLSRQQKLGGLKAYLQVIKRYLAIWGLGGFVSMLQSLYGTKHIPWGVLQAIAVSSLLLLVFIKIPTHFRLVLALVMTTLYQFVQTKYLLNWMKNQTFGGPYGALGWFLLLMISSCIADSFKEYKKQNKYKNLMAYIIVIVLVTLISIFFVPISKRLVSASYILITTMTSTMLFFIFFKLQQFYKIQLLISWGRNSLLLYILQSLFLIPFFIPKLNLHSMDIRFVVGIVLLILIILSLVARVLDQKKIYLIL